MRRSSRTIPDLICCPPKRQSFLNRHLSPSPSRPQRACRSTTQTQQTVSSKVSTSQDDRAARLTRRRDARVMRHRGQQTPTSTHCLRAMEEPGSREKIPSVCHMMLALWSQMMPLLKAIPVLARPVALRRRGLQLVIVDFQFVNVSPRQSRVKAALSEAWVGGILSTWMGETTPFLLFVCLLDMPC